MHHPYFIGNLHSHSRIDRVARTLLSELPMRLAVFSPLFSSLPAFLAQASAALELAASPLVAEAFAAAAVVPLPEAFAAGKQVRQRQDDCLVAPTVDDHSAPAAPSDALVLAGFAPDESPAELVVDDWLEPHSARAVVPSQEDSQGDFPARSRQAGSRARPAFPLPADSQAGWDCRAVP
jgi:hypothetical protein